MKRLAVLLLMLSACSPQQYEGCKVTRLKESVVYISTGNGTTVPMFSYQVETSCGLFNTNNNWNGMRTDIYYDINVSGFGYVESATEINR